MPAPYVGPVDRVFDPLTGRTIDLRGMREGGPAGAATVARGIALDERADANRLAAIQRLTGTLNDPRTSRLTEMVSSDPTFSDELIRQLFRRGAGTAGAEARSAGRAAAAMLG